MCTPYTSCNECQHSASPVSSIALMLWRQKSTLSLSVLSLIRVINQPAIRGWRYRNLNFSRQLTAIGRGKGLPGVSQKIEVLFDLMLTLVFSTLRQKMSKKKKKTIPDHRFIRFWLSPSSTSKPAHWPTAIFKMIFNNSRFTCFLLFRSFLPPNNYLQQEPYI